MMSEANEKENIVEFHCKQCNYSTPYKTNYKRHLNSNKHFRVCNPEKIYPKYVCESCNFITNDKTKYNRHINTIKHKITISKNQEKNTEVSVNQENVIEESSDESYYVNDKNSTTHQEYTSTYNVDNDIESDGEGIKGDNQKGDENDRLMKFMDFTMKMFNEQQKTILEIAKSMKNTVNTVNQVNNVDNSTIINNISVKVLDENYANTPSLDNYISMALSDDETISLIEKGHKFHEIFQHKVIRPMKYLTCSSRPLILVKQKTKARRKNLFVKTENGWRDDSAERQLLSDTIDNTAYNLHRILKKKFYKGETTMTMDEYMDTVFNIREPLLTETRVSSKQNVLRAIDDTLEVSKDEVIVKP